MHSFSPLISPLSFSFSPLLPAFPRSGSPQVEIMISTPRRGGRSGRLFIAEERFGCSRGGRLPRSSLSSSLTRSFFQSFLIVSVRRRGDAQRSLLSVSNPHKSACPRAINTYRSRGERILFLRIGTVRAEFRAESRTVLSHDVALPLSPPRGDYIALHRHPHHPYSDETGASSCHFLERRALLFRLFTAISSPGVSRSTLSRSPARPRLATSRSHSRRLRRLPSRANEEATPLPCRVLWAVLPRAHTGGAGAVGGRLFASPR